MEEAGSHAIQAHKAIYGELPSMIPDLMDSYDDLYEPEEEEVRLYA